MHRRSGCRSRNGPLLHHSHHCVWRRLPGQLSRLTKESPNPPFGCDRLPSSSKHCEKHYALGVATLRALTACGSVRRASSGCKQSLGHYAVSVKRCSGPGTESAGALPTRKNARGPALEKIAVRVD